MAEGSAKKLKIKMNWLLMATDDSLLYPSQAVVSMPSRPSRYSKETLAAAVDYSRCASPRLGKRLIVKKGIGRMNDGHVLLFPAMGINQYRRSTGQHAVVDNRPTMESRAYKHSLPQWRQGANTPSEKARTICVAWPAEEHLVPSAHGVLESSASMKVSVISTKSSATSSLAVQVFVLPMAREPSYMIPIQHSGAEGTDMAAPKLHPCFHNPRWAGRSSSIDTASCKLPDGANRFLVVRQGKS